MCVVDRARRAPFLPHPCPISTDFDSRPKLERERFACRPLPVPSRLNSHACIEAAKHLLHLIPITLPIPPPTHSLSSSHYLDVVSQHRQDAREGPRGLLVIPIRQFLPSRAVNHLIGANPSPIPAPSRTAGTQSDR